MRKSFVIVAVFLAFALNAFGTDAGYKQILVFSTTNSVRVRLPLTEVTGKVRVKEQSPDGFGFPVAPLKTALDKNFYLEWQIGYDTPDTNSPSVVPEIHFQRDGKTKYGHELSKIIFEAVRLHLISTNDLARELRSLKKILPLDLETDQSVQIETDTNVAAGGFQRVVRRVPQFTKTTPHGSVQIQFKQKQRAVGYQAMVYVCLPMNDVLDANGNPRKFGPAKSKETVYYDFTRTTAPFLIDIVHAFGMASQQNNDDLRQILEKILAAATKR